MAKFSRFLLPVLGGIVLNLAFAPYRLSLIAWFAFIPLFFSLRDGEYSFIKGFLMGLAFYGSLLFWIPFSNAGSEVVPQMIAGYILLLIYLSSYFGFSALLYRKLKGLNRIYLFPVVFSGMEFIRSLSSVFGFPWGSLGYSQTNLTCFVQIASFGGVPLVSFWVVSINILIYILIEEYIIRNNSPRRIYLYLLGVMVLFPLLYSGVVVLKGYRSSGEITATVLQPNILPDEKRSGSRRERMEVIRKAILNSPKSDIYILPETASPRSIIKNESTKRFFQELAAEQDALIVTGMPDFEIKKGKICHYNAAGLIDSAGSRGIYRKMFLVPFVERFPYDDVIPIFKKIELGQGHFTPGQLFPVFDAECGKFSVFICYEAIFPQLIRKFVQKDADFLVNITEDSWFGKTNAPYQHAEMAIFRCIEYRRPLLRSANTGVSLIVDPFGRTMKETDIFKEARISATIPLVKGLTVYSRIGDTSGWLFLLFVVGLIFFKRDLDD